MKKSRKKNKHRQNKGIFVRRQIRTVLVLGMLVRGVHASGMEMGGFDVSVGEGEGEIPFEWENNDWEENGWEENDWQDNNWQGNEPSDGFTEPGIPENDQNRDSGDIQWNGDWDDQRNEIKNDTQGSTELPEKNDGAGGEEPAEPDVWNSNGSALPGTNPAQSLISSTDQDREAREASTPEKSSAMGKAFTVERAPIKEKTSMAEKNSVTLNGPAAEKNSALKKSSADTIASAAARKQSRVLSPTTAEVPPLTITPVPVLHFYRGHSEKETEKKELLIHYQKENTKACKNPGFLITGKGGIQILSVRINGAECLWHWKEKSLVLDASAEKESNCIEILALYEAGEEIRAEFQKEIS